MAGPLAAAALPKPASPLASSPHPSSQDSHIRSHHSSHSSSSIGVPLVSSTTNTLTHKLTAALSTTYLDPEIRRTLDILADRGIDHNTPRVRRNLRLDIQHDVLLRNTAVLSDFGEVAAELKNVGQVLESLKAACQEVRGAVKNAKGELDPVLDEATGLEDARWKGEIKRRLLEGLESRVCVTEEERHLLVSAEDIFAGHTGDDGEGFFQALRKVKRIHQRDCEVLMTAENQRLALDVMNDTTSLLEKAYQKVYRWINREFQIMKPGQNQDETVDVDGVVSIKNEDSRNLYLEDPQLNSRLRRALHVLADRPGLFASVLNGFAEARRGVLADSFRRAVSLSENVGTTLGRNDASSAAISNTTTTDERPIGFVAHDPLRYAGDMLAWCHSAMVSEREALESLFMNVDDNDPSELDYRGLTQGDISSDKTEDEKQTQSFDWSQALRDLVNLDLDGVTHVLCSRVEIVIQGLIDPVTAHKMRHLLVFYQNTFSRLFGGDSSVSNLESESIVDEGKNQKPARPRTFASAIPDLAELASEKVKYLLHEMVALLESGNISRVASSDVNPPDYLIEALETLAALARAEADSLVSEADTAQLGDEFQHVIVMGLDPYFAIIEKNSEMIANTEQRLIFKMNCLMAIQDTIAVSQILSSRTPADLQSRIRDEVHTLRKSLIETQASFFRSKSGLEDIHSALSPHLQSTTTTTRSLDINDSLIPHISTLPIFQSSKLLPLAQKLDAFLPSALVDALEQLHKLNSASLAKEVTETAAEVFVDEFERVEDVLLKVDEYQEKQRLTESENAGDGGEGKQREGEEAGTGLDKSLRMMYPRTSHEVRVLLS